MKEDIGGGWSYDPIKAVYSFQNEFFVTRSVVADCMKNWGRKIERVHIVGVLTSIYRKAKGL